MNGGGAKGDREAASRTGSDPGVRKVTLLVLAASAIFGLALVVIIPPWQSPDEPTHFEYVKVLASGDPPWSPRSDPGLQEEIIVSMDRHDYWRYLRLEEPRPLPRTFRGTPFLSAAPSHIGKNPPLYYFLASLVLRWPAARSLESELYRLRLFSLFFTLLTVILVAGCAGEVFGRSSPLVPAATAAAAFIPQVLVIGTSVSPDPPINCIGAAVIYLVLRSRTNGFTPARTFLILCLLGLGVMINYKGLILLAVLPVVLLLHFLPRRRGAPAPARAAGWTGLVALLLAAGYAALVWYFPEVARVFIVRLNIFSSTLLDFLYGRVNFRPGYWSWFHGELFKSFWLKYGWLIYELPGFVYRFLAAASGISLFGVVIFLGRSAAGRGSPSVRRRETVTTLIVFAAAVLVAIYLFWGLKGSTIITQGRHLFLVMPAWAILFTLGWSSLFPARWARLVGYGLLGGFFLLAAGSILFFILPTFS